MNTDGSMLLNPIREVLIERNPTLKTLLNVLIAKIGAIMPSGLAENTKLQLKAILDDVHFLPKIHVVSCIIPLFLEPAKMIIQAHGYLIRRI